MAAVTSAIHIGRMLPYCLYSGSKLAPAYQWLRAQNVTIIEVRGMSPGQDEQMT